jgi:hypothetical protein
VKRILALVAIGAAVACTSACNVTPPAATVNGTAITDSALQNEINQVTQSSSVRCALGILTGAQIPTSGAGSQTVPTTLADAELTALINQDIYTEALAKVHSQLTAVFKGYASNFMAQYLTPQSGSSPCGVSGSQLLAELPSWFVNQQVDLLGSEEQLISVVGHVDLGQSGIEAFYNSNPNDFEELCLDVAEEHTEAEANADRTKLLGGASFASVAESSLDPTLGANGIQANGSFPCAPPTAILDDLPNWAAALDNVNLKQGEPTAAFQDVAGVDQGATGNWLVLEIVGRTKVPLTQELSVEIQEALVSNSASVFVAEQSKLLREANVTVDPEYGSWSPSSDKSLPVVRPPVSPGRSDLLNPNVDASTS